MANERHDHKTHSIIVNGTKELWTDDRISYEQVVQLAFPGSPTDGLFTVTYASKSGRDGMLGPGQSVEVRDGIIFNVGKTSRS